MIFLSFLAVFLWASNFIFVKSGLDHFHFQVFNLIRFAFALPLMYFFRPTQKISQLLTITLFWNILNFNCMGLAIQREMDISLASLILQSMFMFTLLFTFLLNKERHSKAVFFTAPLCFIGLLLFFQEAFQAKSSAENIMLILVSAMSGGLSNTLIRYYKVDSTLGNTIWLSGLAALLQFPIVISMQGLSSFSNIDISACIFPFAAFIFSTIFANYIWIHVNRYLSTSFLSHMMLLVPILTVIFGVVLYGEKLSIARGLAAILILFSVIAPTYVNRRIRYENS